MSSITIHSHDLIRDGPTIEVEFHIPIELEKKYSQEGRQIPKPVKIKSMIDTGASSCVIQQEIPEKLGLKPTGIANINTPSCKNHECYLYFMRMIVPSCNISYEGVFIAAPLQGQVIDSLIGRDILSKSILIYIGLDNSFTFSLN